ncbi:MAG: PAS domain S-box protein [Anaerolineales bacterium]
MSEPIRILIVEDLLSDFELAQLELRRSAANCIFKQVETRQDFLNALETFQPDVILSDYSLPHFDGMTALKLAKEHMPLIPFIIWTGSLSEDVAVECMKAGANNYILKENLKRLGPAVIHAVEERQLLLERTLAEEKLRDSEERFRALIENSLDNISLLAPDGTLLWENPAVNRTLGYGHDEFVSRNIFELMHPDDMKWTSELFAKVSRQPHEQRRGTFRLRHHDGTWRWIEATATNMLDNSSVNAVVINYREVTERKLTEIKIQQQNDDLQLINAINEMALRNAELDEIVSLLSKELKRIFNSSGSTFYTLSPDGTTLTMQQYHLSPEVTRRVEKIIGSTIPLIQLPIQKDGFFHKVLDSQRGYITSDREEIESWLAEFINTPFLPPLAKNALSKLIPQLYDLLNIKSTIAIPLMLNGKSIGLLDVSSAGMFTEDDLERMENIGKQLTASIQRQQANEQIRRSESFLQSVQNALSASIAILNEEGMIVQVNAAWRKFGEQNDLQHPHYGIGLNYLAICDATTGAEAEIASQTARLIREVITGKRPEAQLEYPCHGPEEKRWFILRITKFDDGEHIWVVLAHENISEQKKAMAQVAHQAHLLSDIHDAVVSFDKDFIVTSWNHAAEKLYGWKAEEVIGKFGSEVLPAIFFDATQEKTIEQLRNAGQYQAEVIHTCKDGGQIDIETRISSLINQDGEQVYVAVNRDITERKKAEQSLKETSNQFQTLFEASPDALLLIEPQGEWPIVGCNTAACQMNGYARDELIGQPIRIINTTPGTVTERAKYLERIRASKILKYEDRHRRKDGTVFPIEVSTSLITVGGREMVLGIDRDITNRKQAEEALREGERRYRALFEEMPIAVWEEDYSRIKNYLDTLKKQGITNFREYFSTHPDALARCTQMIGISDVNQTAVQMFEAADKQELIMTTLEELSEGEREHNLEDILAIADGRISNRWEGADTTCKGRPIVIELSWSVVPGYENDYSRVITTTIDITERKRMESAEREQRALAEALLDTAETLNSTLEYGEVLDHILTAVEKVVPHDAATILLLDQGIARVARARGYQERGLHTEIMGIELSLQEAVNLQKIVESGQPIVVSDTRNYPGWKIVNSTEWLCSNVGAPISLHDEVVGFILLDSKTPDFFTSTHAERLKAFASQAAIAIQNARLLQQAQEEITERKQSQAKVSELLTFNATILNNSPVGILTYKRTGECSYANEYASQIIGIDVKGLMSQNYQRLDSWKHSGLYDLAEQAAQSEKMAVADIHHISTVGKDVWVSARFTRFIVNEEENILLIISDITERKQAEKELKEEKEKAQKYLDIAGVTMLALDREGNVTLINQKGCEILGYSNDEIVGKNWLKTFIPESMREDVEDVFQRLIEDVVGASESYEYPVLIKSGEQRMIAWHNTLVRDGDGKVIASLSSGEDITERKRAEDKLRLSEERFRQMAENIEESFWMTDAITGEEIYISPTGEKIWGRSVNSLLSDQNIFFESIFPEDLPHVMEEVAKEKSGSRVEMEYRVIHPDGTLHWVWDRAFPIFDEAGQVIRIAGIAADITERKRAQEELRDSENRYRGLFENLVIGFALHEIITDEEGQPVDYTFLEINPMFEKLTGIKAKEVVGRRATEVLPSLENERFIPIYGRVALTGEFTHLEEFSRDLNKYYEINAYSPKQGQFAVTFIDITERKKADEELRKLSRAVEQSASTIVITDTDGNIEYANPRFTETTGYTLEEARGRNPRILKSDFTTPEEYEHLWQTITDGQEWHGEFMNKKKNGELYWEYVTITPIFNDREEITHFLAIKENITERKSSEADAQRHLSELEALYENGLALGRLLNPREIGERIISTFARHLSWHHVAIRLLQPGSDILELIAFNIPDTNQDTRTNSEHRFQLISRLGQGLSGWVAQTGEPFRTGNVHESPQYVDTYAGIESGLYMPLKIGDQVLGVISVESEKSNAFTPQDERLLATLANQAAVAFENARLYQTNQQERERFSELFENTPVATWLEDFSAVIAWMDRLRDEGVVNLRGYLEKNPEQYRLGVRLIDIIDVNHAAVVMNGARNKEELIGKIHELMMEETPSSIMMNELDLIWKGYTSFGFEMSSRKLDGSIITGIQRIYIPANNNEPDYGRVIVTSTDITERVGFEQQLRASEIHYRELADSITDIFFELDQNLRYSHWNKASEILTGVSAKNAINKTMADVFGTSEDQKRNEKIYRDVLEKHVSRTFGTTFIIQDMPRDFEITAYPSTRGVAVVAKDVTERKRSESLMQKRFELMEYSSDHSLDELMHKVLSELSIWTHSPIGFFQLMKDDQNTPDSQVWTTGTLSDFHASQAEFMHKSIDQAGVWADAVRQRQAVIHNDYASMSEKKGLPEGHTPITRELVLPIIRNEKIVAVVGVGNKPQDYNHDDLGITERFADYAWDVIERKQMVIEIAEERNQLAKRVEERTSDLSRANSNLARALRVKDEFLANMSHELRTPLNAILGLSESLSEQTAGPLNEKQQKYLTTISESGHHLLSLINDILDLAKIEAGQITLDINKVDVHSVSQASLRMIKQLAQKKNLEVVVDIDDEVGLMWADERRLKQMIVNLLSNAVKFTPEGGKLGLQITGNQNDNKVMITVWDTGIGIKEEDFERLFKPFVQLDAGLARESSGTGLGLALVAQMARLHGGSVSVESDAGKGSRFTIILPWEPALAADAVERMKVTGQFRTIRPGKVQQTILVIEDTQEVVMMLKDYLEIAGYIVATAQDGLDGIAQAKFHHPDLILMDVQMPRMDGLEATQKLRQDPEFKHTPIIALTALAMPNDRERCITAGMDEYISKPVNLRGLIKLIQNYLSLREEETRPR